MSLRKLEGTCFRVVEKSYNLIDQARDHKSLMSQEMLAAFDQEFTDWGNERHLPEPFVRTSADAFIKMQIARVPHLIVRRQVPFGRELTLGRHDQLENVVYVATGVGSAGPDQTLAEIYFYARPYLALAVVYPPEMLAIMHGRRWHGEIAYYKLGKTLVYGPDKKNWPQDGSEVQDATQ